MKKIFKNFIGLCSLGIVASALFVNCSSSDDSSNPVVPGLEGKNMKFTITIDNVTKDDYISFVVSSSSFNTNTIWKVNGTERSNENVISLNDESFSGSTKTYVIESTVALPAASLGMQFIPFNNKSITYSYKAEINGKVIKDEQNITITNPSSYNVQYTY
mgnify:FL=1